MDDIRYIHLHNLLKNKLVELYKPTNIRETPDTLPLDITSVYYKAIRKNTKYKKPEFSL